MSAFLDVVLGVDVGTTHTKAIALDLVTGARVGFGRQTTSWTHFSDGRVETGADTFVTDALAAMDSAVRCAAAGNRGRVRVAGIGLTGLAETGVLLDGSGAPTTPAIAWFDTRGSEELAALSPEFQAAFPARTGLALRSQWSFAKLLWLRGTGVDLGADRCWLNIPEYVAYALTGSRVTEASLASRTGLLDQATGTTWQPALERLGSTEALIPPLVQAGRPCGVVNTVEELRGAVVTVTGHDHPVAAVGAGAVGPDQLFNSSGTADVVLRSVPRILTDDERERLVADGVEAGRHVLAGRSALIGGVRGGLVLRRILALLGRDDPELRDGLDRQWRSDAAAGGGGGALTVRGAHGDDNDVTITIKDGASPDAAWAAALQHVGAETAALLAAISSVVGEHRSAIAAGGWTRMRSVRAVKSSVIPDLTFSAIEEPGALGAAFFASWAVAGTPGEFSDFTRRQS
jgi:sugar (pentulose or hexulose) kinase